MDEKEPFLSRWSRRKREAKADAPGAALPADELPAGASAAQLPTAPLPAPAQPAAAATTEGIGSEYREYFDPRVDEKLRRSALKKLFGDPHFNVMDGLDTYIDDYAKPDPVPEAMLRQLNQAKGLFLFDEKQAEEGSGDGPPSVAGDTVPTVALGAGDTDALAEPARPSLPDEAAGAATSAAAGPPRNSS